MSNPEPFQIKSEKLNQKTKSIDEPKVLQSNTLATLDKQCLSNEPVKTNFEIERIKKSINELDSFVKNLIKTENKSTFEMEMDVMIKFPEFYDEFPSLCKKVCKQDDISMLYKMLENLYNVQSGNKSLASVEYSLGNELATKYIPNFKEK